MKSENARNSACCCYRKDAGSSSVGFILLLTAVMGLLYYTTAHHIIMTNGGIKVYPKKTLTLQDSYLDVTKMPVTELRFHEDAVASMIDQGDVQYLPGGDIIVSMINAGRSISDAIQRIDTDFQITDSAREAARITHGKYEALDGKYKLGEKAKTAQQKLKAGAGKLNDWLKEQ